MGNRWQPELSERKVFDVCCIVGAGLKPGR